MVAYTILAGGFDAFVATYLFNSHTSSLSLIEKSPTGLNCSWISLHPTNASIIYAVNEITEGAIQSFVIKNSGILSPAVETVSAGGTGPAFAVALSTGQVAATNYAAGTGRIVPTTSSPLHFNDSAPVITFPVPAGGISHPHMALEYGREVLFHDLGEDKIWRMVEDGSPGTFRIHGSIPQPHGSGPRHIAIYNDRLYTLHELASTLTVQTLNGPAHIIDSVSIIPPNGPAGAAGEILIPKPTKRFPIPYIYVSNRNTGVQDPKGDSIAIFEHVNRGRRGERLVLQNQVYTGLDQIRGMEFGREYNGGEEYLMASGVAGTGDVIVLKSTQGGRNLEVVVRNSYVLQRSTSVWL